ncbi:hypothetical protein [Parvularcula sp. LCG005]|uniref:hypothetical protein n=1 Tax=Parvularcula sp. LCG005 TaxID=3078805 RepID=UPI002941D21C|nr:hypothetical protein [Parvularcula sp. LCG005]WOI53027.1 hypothetical protein RUI03_12810 [Parvularcula sp. LCG005]WOI53041.1 hypothetical protein RUI03_12885 [Parvularcula sp. LCG005]
MTNFTPIELEIRRNREQLEKLLYQSYPAFLQSIGFTLYMTATFNRGAMPLHIMKATLRQYVKGVERDLLGKHFYKKPSEQRLRGIFFAEKIDSNAHWHGGIVLPPAPADCTPEDFYSKASWLLEHKWKHFVASGDVKVADARETSLSGCNYISKERWKADHCDQIVFLQDFWRMSKPGRTG